VDPLQSQLARQRAEHQKIVEGLQTELVRRTAKYQGIITSITWRATSPIRNLLGRSPWVTRQAHQVLQLITITFQLPDRFLRGRRANGQTVKPRLPQLGNLSLSIHSFSEGEKAATRAKVLAALTGSAETTAHTLEKTEGHSISSLPLNDYLDDGFYISQDPRLIETSLKPLQHYLDQGWKEGRSPHPLFDLKWYLEHNPDVLTAGAEPLQHYLNHGWKEGRSPHPLFDLKWYLEHNPDVLAAGAEPLQHYLNHGWKEGRSPHPLFDLKWYLEHNPNVLAEPLTHYLQRRVHNSRPSKSEHPTDAVDPPRLLGNRFPYLAPLRTFSASKKQRRVNLVTDSISQRSLIGGLGTAIVFSILLAKSWNCPLRIITRKEKPEAGNVKDVLLANNISWKNNIEFLFAHVDDDHAHVDLSREDVFVTTSWWTTWSTVQNIRNNRIIYLLQEDERMLYPEGDAKRRCQETMSNPEINILVNSYSLYRHLLDDGFGCLKQRGMWFEPSIIENAGQALPVAKDAKKWSFLFYARPSANVINLFSLGLKVIEKALLSGIIDANDWNFFVVGDALARIKLYGDVEPTMIQNIKWSQYRAFVSSMDLGLSLISTPQPSYHPLDLAASGAVVVTNTFGAKTDLASYSANIICGSPTIAGLTTAL
jgi:hypothetical protein